MEEKAIYMILLTALVILGLCHSIIGQQSQVESKLDYDDVIRNNSNGTDKSNTTSVEVDREGDNKDNRRKPINEEREESTSVKPMGKTRPRIHGVRVTVDTSDPNSTKESKESIEITDFSKHKKRVGIHTDITFEITDADSDDKSNKTSSQESSSDKDASVPIFKGRRGPSNKHKKPYDTKPQWNPNEHRVHDYSGQHGTGYPYDFQPEYYPQNIPNYAGIGEPTRPGGTRFGIPQPDNLYRPYNAWNSYVPRYWTTERPVSQYRPKDVSGYRRPVWKPCTCIPIGNDYRQRRDNVLPPTVQSEIIFQPTSSLIEVIDGKFKSSAYGKM